MVDKISLVLKSIFDSLISIEFYFEKFKLLTIQEIIEYFIFDNKIVMVIQPYRLFIVIS